MMFGWCLNNLCMMFERCLHKGLLSFWFCSHFFCLNSIWMMPECCSVEVLVMFEMIFAQELHDVFGKFGHFLAVFMISQRCLNDVRTMSEWCPLLFWCLKDVRLMSCCHFDYVSILFCLDIMWMIFEWCLDDVWMMSEMIFELFVDDFLLSFFCCCPFFAIDVLLISVPCLDILISMMSYWCLNDVWMLSSSSFCNVVIVFVVSIMFGWGINNIWMISEWCLHDIRRMSYWCCFHFMLSK